MNDLQKIRLHDLALVSICIAGLVVGCKIETPSGIDPGDADTVLVCTTSNDAGVRVLSFKSEPTDWINYQEKNGQWYISGQGYYKAREGEMCGRRSIR